MATALQTMTNELTHVFLLSVGAFLLAMFLTPIYTFFAYRYRFWKRQRSESTDGKKLKIFAKFQAAEDLGLPVIVIDRPVLDYPHLAHTFEEVKQFVDSVMES